MEDDHDNSRATVIGMKTEDFDQVEEITDKLIDLENLKLEELLHQYKLCPLIRDDVGLI